MGHIEEPPPTTIQPARDRSRPEPSFDLFGAGTVGRRESCQDALGHRGVAPLMGPRQTEWATPFVVGWKHSYIGPGPTVSPSNRPPGLPPQHFDQRRVGFADYERSTRLGDPGLLTGNLLEGVAQILHVIPRDLGHSTHQRSHHVGAVEPPAQAYFHDCDLG